MLLFHLEPTLDPVCSVQGSCKPILVKLNPVFFLMFGVIRVTASRMMDLNIVHWNNGANYTCLGTCCGGRPTLRPGETTEEDVAQDKELN